MHRVPNLVRGLVPSAPDQIWVADITYVHLAKTFACLAVTMPSRARLSTGLSPATSRSRHHRSRPGNPFDNAKAESFMIAEVYNQARLQSAPLGYQSPEVVTAGPSSPQRRKARDEPGLFKFS
ncbi:hypothetical protein [Bradyrhizobium sp. Gha]|uniref:hypothetical protein n=1 Tax=Bradyrhizobium sp. Gha TaxID=1855318 RepID=UPI0008E7F438|nr:hypothetical protein [Bradyrhizobium sp. Gha]SFI82695.1 hypothetical protein SAMN05216525_114103 [Bradyrhizobium sp. Gha]